MREESEPRVYPSLRRRSRGSKKGGEREIGVDFGACDVVRER